MTTSNMPRRKRRRTEEPSQVDAAIIEEAAVLNLVCNFSEGEESNVSNLTSFEGEDSSLDQTSHHGDHSHSLQDMEINECLEVALSCEKSKQVTSGALPGEVDLNLQDEMNYSILGKICDNNQSTSSDEDDHDKGFIEHSIDDNDLHVNECLKLALENQDSNQCSAFNLEEKSDWSSPLCAKVKESRPDLGYYEAFARDGHPDAKRILFEDDVTDELELPQEEKSEDNTQNLVDYVEVTEKDESSSKDDDIRKRLVFNLGLSGVVDQYSTPLKVPIHNDDSCSLSITVDSESETSQEDDEDDKSMVDFDEERSENEILPIIDDLLGDFEGRSTVDESIAGICELDNVTPLTKASLLNEVKLYKDNNSPSVNEAILKIMRLHVKNKQSKSGLQRTITTMCSLLPEGHKMPSSAYSMLKYVENLAPPVPAIIHFYCKSCLFYYGTEIVSDRCCQICNVKTEFGRFFIYDIASLIKHFFESRNLASLLDSEARKDSENCDFRRGVRSIKDGSVYKSLNANRSKYDLNIILGSDGVRIRKGSSRELWLALFTISELPIHLQRSFLSVVGVWYDEKKPDMKTFLKPFAETMQSLDRSEGVGIKWTHPFTKEVNKSFVGLLVTELDAPARAITQNVLQFNGRFGCNICEIKTQLSERVPGKPDLKAIRVYYYVANPKLRTKERMLKQAERVLAEGAKHIKGVKGPSVLSMIPSVDISQCIVPEYMHSVLLGVVRQQVIIWIEKSGPWSLVNRAMQIDDFLITFKHPDFVHRKERQLKNLKFWKASDFYYFLLLESLLSLSGHLPDVYLQHFTLLVKGIFTLLKTFISDSEIDEADLLLKLYVCDFKKLYGSRELTHNVHQLVHLGLCVRRFGPLHCFSAFPFEDLNGLIAKSTHGTNHVDAEIDRNIRICQGINILQCVVEGCDGLDLSNRYCEEGEFLGNPVTISTPNELLPFLSDNEVPKIYSRAKLGYDTFTSEVHKTLSTENFHVMWTEDDVVKYGSIKYFAETKKNRFVVLQLLTVKQTLVLFHRETRKSIEHIVPVEESNVHIAPVKDIVPSVIKVGKIGCYVYKRPNLYRYVL